ncbi:T9SS type A sorting domain-containing protein [Frigoriflavimonas asaccharolytica]|uniref:Putative small secreted protein n=1 Tax=Frigoriflavimonas asaccharolytica TaxID=2735899 RepID=A0A8J8G735_9FLAO|nr:T9SS type A sorting domain-containing protein [Frigoriflavimonas asaccharolytica]NRS92531.1 putative small secreted protein [Frigoriflavimonas asaccharolytica]
MKKNLLVLGALAVSLSASAQLMNVNGSATGTTPAALFYITEGTLVYSGGGVQTKGNGQIDNHGNMMIVGEAIDVLKTTAMDGTTPKTDGGNIVLRMNAPLGANSTYGQLSIEGLAQTSLTGIVSKEFLTPKHGTGLFYQQIAIPFYDKPLSTLSAEFGKTFSTVRYSRNEILTWNNTTAVSDDVGPLSTTTTGYTKYYMLGSNNDLDTSTPPATLPTIAPSATGSVYTLKGRANSDGPFVGVPLTASLQNAGAGINYGVGGNALNSYNERYNTYLQDQFEATSSAWAGTFGKNIYQFGNPFFTNLDLSKIGYTEAGGVNDDNQIVNIWGVRFSPGTVKTLTTGSTYSIGAQIQTYVQSTGLPVGDASIMIKPMQTFVLKLRNSNAVPDIKFNKLRRFKNVSRLDGTSYSVTAAKNTTGTLKQLGVIALNSNGDEIGRTYYVVSPTSITGHQTNTDTTVQAASGAGVIKTFEEDPINGMYDYNYTSKYALYINEANEFDFNGKPVPLALYSSDIASLKFEIRENVELLPNQQQDLSTGIAFYYKTSTGATAAISQNMVIPTNGGTEFGLSYGPITSAVLGTVEAPKGSRTLVVYNEAIDNYVVQFDPKWKSADVQVYDMSGKIVISAKNVKTAQDFVINLTNKIQGTYIVTGTNESGEKFTSKIIR